MATTRQRTIIPEDFEVSDRIVELAKKNGWPDPYTQVEAFKDHHIANGTLMANWEAAFRTWLTRAVVFNRAPTGNKPITSQPAVKESEADYMTPEQRRENQRKLREIVDGLTRKVST